MRFVILLIVAIGFGGKCFGQRSGAGATTRWASTRPASLAEARRVVFLVDSRVLQSLVGKVREELNLAIDHLREKQMFTIVVCRGRNKVPRVFHANPVRATKAVKEEAVDFLRGIEEERDSNVVAGIRKAVGLQADLSCFVAGDLTPETEGVRRAFGTLRGRLNVVLFTATMPHPVEFLRTLALEHGGVAMDQRVGEVNGVRAISKRRASGTAVPHSGQMPVVLALRL